MSDITKISEKNINFKKYAKTAGSTISFGMVGEVVGYIIAQFVADSVMPDLLIAQIGGVLFGLIGMAFSYSKYKTQAGKNLRDCLEDADKLFIDNYISDIERLRLRNKCLDSHLK